VALKPRARRPYSVSQKAQQFHLYRQRHVADLVQEQGPAIDTFNSADRLLERSGERAPFVTEELAFEKRLGNRRTIDWHKRLARTGTQFVDRPGGQLLVGAALAAQQYCNVGGRHFSMLRSTLNISGLLVMIPSICNAAEASRSLRISAKPRRG
jgi:hypothetical protein